MLHHKIGFGAIAGGLILTLLQSAPALSCGDESNIIRARGLTPVGPSQTLDQPSEPTKANNPDSPPLRTAPATRKQSQAYPSVERLWTTGGYSNLREEGRHRCGNYGGPDRLTALIPEAGPALTLSNAPTLLVYVPQTRGLMASVWVFNTSDQTSREYSIQLPERAGILVIDLASLNPNFPLQNSAVYEWGFEILADSDRAGNPFVVGSIARQPVDVSLAQVLSRTSLRDRLDLYTQAGLWYDALATAAALHRAEPSNRNYTELWHAMLDSVGLSHLAEQPLLEIPTQPQSIATPVEP